MVKLPMEVAEVDRQMVMLNGKPAMRICGVDEGDEVARRSLPKLQQAHLYDEDSARRKHQRQRA